MLRGRGWMVFIGLLAAVFLGLAACVGWESIRLGLHAERLPLVVPLDLSTPGTKEIVLSSDDYYSYELEFAVWPWRDMRTYEQYGFSQFEGELRDSYPSGLEMCVAVRFAAAGPSLEYPRYCDDPVMGPNYPPTMRFIESGGVDGPRALLEVARPVPALRDIPHFGLLHCASGYGPATMSKMYRYVALFLFVLGSVIALPLLLEFIRFRRERKQRPA